MAFGVKGGKVEDATASPDEAPRVVPAITGETVVALVVLVAMFAVFAWEMGLAATFETAMATAHDLLLNTVLFLMAVMILAGAFTSLIAEFGIVAVANRALAPLMGPLFGLPGAASVGVVATYLSDNPAIMPLGIDRGFLKYFRRWQVATLVNLGTVFGMGLIVTTFMLAQSSGDQPLGRAVLIGNVGAILGMGSLMSLAANPAGASAGLTPLAPDIAAATGWPLKTAMLSQVTSFMVILLPYQVAPVLTAMLLGRVDFGRTVRLCLAYTAIYVIVITPLNFLWWRWLGMFGSG